MEVLTNITVGIISQYISASKQHIVHLKLIYQLYFNKTEKLQPH